MRASADDSSSSENSLLMRLCACSTRRTRRLRADCSLSSENSPTTPAILPCRSLLSFPWLSASSFTSRESAPSRLSSENSLRIRSRCVVSPSSSVCPRDRSRPLDSSGLSSFISWLCSPKWAASVFPSSESSRPTWRRISASSSPSLRTSRSTRSLKRPLVGSKYSLRLLASCSETACWCSLSPVRNSAMSRSLSLRITSASIRPRACLSASTPIRSALSAKSARARPSG